LKLELRDLKKLFITLKDDNQNLYENFEDQKRKLNKKSEDVCKLRKIILIFLLFLQFFLDFKFGNIIIFL